MLDTLTPDQLEATRLWVANQQRELRPLTPEQEAATKLWLASLEMERTDRSYLRKPAPKPAAEPVVIVKTVTVPGKPAEVDKKAQRTRDKVMFHAGRFAGGARDPEATEANRLIGSYINGKRQ